MAFFTDIIDRIDAMRGLVGDVMVAEDLPSAIDGLADADALLLMVAATDAAKSIEQMRALAAGVIARRSDRDAGHKGLAQSRGHRTPITLVQEITGSSRAEAAKQVRVGESLLDALRSTAGPTGDADIETADSRDPAPPRWDAPLGRALFAGSLSTTQHDAILRGLGEPPAVEFAEVWPVAAAQLVEEAPHRTVEELSRTSRTVRDRLDPDGALARFEARYEARAFRMYTDADGIHRGHFVFDDEGAAWVRTIVDSAMRPRRGGPRFVDRDEKKRAEELVEDARNNDQLSYDLVLDVLRAGGRADAKTVFGTRQAGVRLVQVIDDDALAHLEDDGSTVPAWLTAQRTCDTGTSTCIVDRDGNPLYLGREHRLFSPRQRVALAIRDGGCRWKGCDRPSSYCEAHHIDEYDRDQGRTDIDRGILLCRFHHMNLHHGGWRITRNGTGKFLLHPPGGGEAITLNPRLALRYAWNGADPPPKRFRPAA